MAATQWLLHATRALFLIYAVVAFVRGESYCSCTSSGGKEDREYCNYDCCGAANTSCSTVCCKFSLPGLIVGIFLLLVFVIVLVLLIRVCWKHHKIRKGVVINRLANEGVSSQSTVRYAHKRKKKVAPISDSQTDSGSNGKKTPYPPPPPPAYGYYPAQSGPDKPSDQNYPPLPPVVFGW